MCVLIMVVVYAERSVRTLLRRGAEECPYVIYVVLRGVCV